VAKQGKKQGRAPDGRGKQHKPSKKGAKGADGPGGYPAAERPDVVLVVDVAYLTVADGELVVLLVERGREPHRGRWSVPGVVLDPDEAAADAAVRAVVARAGIPDPFVHQEQLDVFDAVGRDPRTRVVSATVLGVAASARPPAGGTLAGSRWWPVAALGDPDGPALAFDHGDIVAAGVERLGTRLEHTDLATALVAEPFTLGELRRAYEAVWGVELEPANFRRKVLSTPGFVARTAGKRIVGTGRPADLYVRGGGAVLHPPLPRGR